MNNPKRERLIRGLKLASKQTGKYLSQKRYKRLSVEKGYPSVTSLVNMFGSWSEAKEAAGLEVRKHRTSKWSKKELENAMESADNAIKGGVTRRGYNRFREQQEETLPSPRAFMNRYGSWRKAVKQLTY